MVVVLKRRCCRSLSAVNTTAQLRPWLRAVSPELAAYLHA